MWRTRYKNVFKTSNSNLVITAVCAFPNINDTLEKVIKYYDVKKLQNDKLLLDIIAEDNLISNGSSVDFIPLYFVDDVPKLDKLQKIKPIGKGFFWCICYIHPSLRVRNEHQRTINSPSHDEYIAYLKHYLENYHDGSNNGGVEERLFVKCVKSYIYMKTKHFSDEIKSRRFDLIENKSLRVVNAHVNDRIKPSEYFEYFENMYNRDIYEFMFTEFK